MIPKHPDEKELPLPLQAIALAQLPPEYISPPLIRSIEQWSAVTPLPIIVQALGQVSDCDDAPTQFRQALLNNLERGTLSKQEQPRVGKQAVPSAAATKKGIPPTVIQALLAQQRLINMDDAEYQAELVRRLKQKR
ncbi:MAG TPA: hypothetical protein GXZ82_10520 [Firmicutes bacterium]|nr:hypothetical protein [Bacillota bacterium]